MNERHETVLRLACSPEKRELMQQLANCFNGLRFESASGSPVSIAFVELRPDPEPHFLLEEAVDAVCPESSLWLDELGRSLEETGLSARVEAVTLFTASPIVLGMWEGTAHALGHPQRKVGLPEV